MAKIIIEYEKDQDAADDIDDVRQAVARRNQIDSPNVTLQNGGEDHIQMMGEVVSSLAIVNENLDRLFNQHSLKEAIDALEYIESYLEGALDRI